MKKTYNAPELYYEEYELSTAIAGNCGYVANASAADWQSCSCSVDIGGGDYLFGDMSMGCNTEPFENDSICYQTFATSNMLFNS